MPVVGGFAAAPCRTNARRGSYHDREPDLLKINVHHIHARAPTRRGKAASRLTGATVDSSRGPRSSQPVADHPDRNPVTDLLEVDKKDDGGEWEGEGEGSEEESLRAKVAKLQEVVAHQSQLLQQQAESLKLLQAYLVQDPNIRSSPILRQISDEDFAGRASMAKAVETVADRRLVGAFDARYHSTSSGATPRDFRILPRRIILVRHAESEGNVDNFAYTYLPDPQVPLTPKGWRQALEAGERIRQAAMHSNGSVGRLFFYTSPYLRSRQTFEGVAQAFRPEEIGGVQEEVQLREQDFGNFQDAEGKRREKAERLRFGRFFYRFPNGESGADVYDRMTLFEDHLVRDINAGRFSGDCSLVLLTHGLAARIFLMRWFHWTVDQFMGVYNPPNAAPLILERIPDDGAARPGGPVSWIHTKALYKLSAESMVLLQGCTPDMCETSWMPRGLGHKNQHHRPPEVHELLEPVAGEEPGFL